MEMSTHGGDIYSFDNGEVLDFSANINPLGLASGVREAILNSTDKCVHYPDPLCRELKKSIAEWENVTTDRIVCGNGAADVIFRLVQAIRPKQALLLAPTFSEYECALGSAGCTCAFYALNQNTGFVLDEGILEHIHKGLDMVFICNPNNPTGLVAAPQLMRSILEKCAEMGILLVVDECFIDFLDEPASYTIKPYLKGYPNLFILKAFTKLFAIPGLRLGYGLCGNTRMIDLVSRWGQAWSVSVPAQEAGIAAVLEKEYVQKTREVVRMERQYLKSRLEALGCTVYNSQANYVFFKLAGGTMLQDYLKKKQMLIRSCANYRGLTPEYYRIAVRLKAQNELLIVAIDAYLKDGDK
jgi:threonine-phosphate decarboxylase